MLETVFICRKLGELKPDLTTTAHFAIQLSYYAMSYLQHPLQSRAGGFFVLVEGVVVDIQRGGGLFGGGGGGGFSGGSFGGGMGGGGGAGSRF